MRQRLQLVCAMVVVTLITACSVFGVPPPETFNQRAALAITQVTAVRESATELLRADVITVDDAENVQKQANLAREGIDLAIVFKATDPAKAENRLEAANVIIDALKEYLRRQQP